MADHPQLDAALKRLAAALDFCEAAAERCPRAGDAALDLALARTRELESAAEQVTLRLGQAGVTLRRLLAEAD